MWITGRHPVEELLGSSLQRPTNVLIAASVPRDAARALAAKADAAGVACVACPREEWSRRTGQREGAGIAAEIAEFRYFDLAPWTASLSARATVFLLDGVTDPQNLGSVLRSARAFGFSGVVLPRDRSCPVTGAVFRASAGAAAHVPVIQVTNLVRAVEHLQEAGFWVYAALREGDRDVSTLPAGGRTGFVLGSEDTGIRRLVREKCDGSVRIPMERGTDSLNVGVAAGILGFCAYGFRDPGAA